MLYAMPHSHQWPVSALWPGHVSLEVTAWESFQK